MKILVTGESRSGTTVLAAMLGAHSQISMCSEPATNDWRKQVGTPIVGLKCTLGSGIVMRKRKSLWWRADALNRLINPIGKTNLRFIPRAEFSFEDLLKEVDRVIVIYRDSEEVRESNIRRTGMSERTYRMRKKIADKQIGFILSNAKTTSLLYEDLCSDPEGVASILCSMLDIEYEPTMLEGAKYNYYQKPLK